MRTTKLMLAGVLITVAASVMAAPAQAPRGFKALSQIEPGLWVLKETGSAAAPRALCVADPDVLLQLGHTARACSRFVIADTPLVTTIHYTCPGAGHGRTTITVETGRLLHIQTQGITAGAPFDNDYEARRTGACTGVPTKTASR